MVKNASWLWQDIWSAGQHYAERTAAGQTTFSQIVLLHYARVCSLGTSYSQGDSACGSQFQIVWQVILSSTASLGLYASHSRVYLFGP